MAAIKNVGGNLVAALDPHDSVGILDSFFPDCHFFTEFERFDRFVSHQIRNGTQIDYVSICSPNYLHDAHCRYALRIGANAICEKPLVVRERNLNVLKQLENEHGRDVYTILQLRCHPTAQELKEKFALDKSHHVVRVEYVTPRGNWYAASWKGDVSKSGGLATNIGIHLFDLAVWLFGPPQKVLVERASDVEIQGVLELHTATVTWRLSIRSDEKRQRLFVIDGKNYDFPEKEFTNLHTTVYERTLAGRGFGIEQARLGVKVTEAIRSIVYPIGAASGEVSFNRYEGADESQDSTYRANI